MIIASVWMPVAPTGNKPRHHRQQQQQAGITAMELATTSCAFSAPGASTSGRKRALHFRSPKLATFSISSFEGLLLSQNSSAARCRPPVVAFAAKKKPEDPASSSADVPDAINPIEKASALNEGQPVRDEGSKKNSTDSTAAPATREQVLKACVNTSAALAAAGLVIRQGTHFAAEAQWSIPDCYVEMPYAFEVWHLGAAAGTVLLIASLRQILLSTWPEFSQSSRQSNKQVLSPLQLNDYLVVSFLPGISEELLFRGAILPLVGVDWRGVAAAGLIFGILHISGGRNAAFAAWASFVGVVYGLAAIYTTDLAVPMIAHSAANLVAAYVWRIEEDENMKMSK